MGYFSIRSSSEVDEEAIENDDVPGKVMSLFMATKQPHLPQ